MGNGGIAPYIPNIGIGDEWSSSFPGHFIPLEGESSTHYIGGSVGPRDGLDAEEKE
jgi:hypothetical protein